MNNRIALFKDQRGWHAQYFGPHADKIQELFGTTILPLPYTPDAKATKVLRKIQGGYPEVTVEFRDQMLNLEWYEEFHSMLEEIIAK